MGRRRGGLTAKIRALVDAKGRPLRLLIIPGRARDVGGLRSAAGSQAEIGRPYRQGNNADWIRAYIRGQGGICNISNKGNRPPLSLAQTFYKKLNPMERFFNKLKQFRRIATRYDKLGAASSAFILSNATL